MIYIYHGDNQNQSRSAYNQFLDSCINSNILRTDSNQINLDQITIFLTSLSLIEGKKIVAFSNFFSIPKSQQEKLIKLIIDAPEVDYIIWQDKKLTTVQLKTFPQAEIIHFPINKKLFSCLNSLKPHNSKQFFNIFQSALKEVPYDLFLYLLKNQLRKQLSSDSHFDPHGLKQAYLNLIDLDHQNKTGLLTTPKEIALERILIRLLEC